MTELPLPLTALKGGHIVDPNGWTVAKCYGDYSEEYARLIVAAVNSHAALLSDAKIAARILEEASRPPIMLRPAFTIVGMLTDARAILEVAIAKAEEHHDPT